MRSAMTLAKSRSVVPMLAGPPAELCKPFRTTVRFNKRMGFTSDGIFIPPALVALLTIGSVIWSVADKRGR